MEKQTVLTPQHFLESGWHRAEYWCGVNAFIKNDSKGREHQINIDFDKKLIIVHRISIPKRLMVDGVIGKFVAGQGRKRAANAYKYLDIKTLDKIESFLDFELKK